MKIYYSTRPIVAAILLLLTNSSCHARSTFAPRPYSVTQIPRGGDRVPQARPAAVRRSNNNKNKVSGGTASASSLIFNLVKAIMGVGVLSLPAGIAKFGDSPSVLVPALFLIASMGTLSGFGFATIGKVCSYTGASTYREAWAESVGPKTSWIPACSTTFKTFFACLAISMVLADTFGGLLQRSPDERTAILVTLTVVILLPLCWMKNLASLAPFSLVGIIGMLYTAFAMTLRYLDGSYGVGGALREQLADNLQPAFGDAGWKSALQPNTLILVCMLSTAYMAHFIAPKVYQELENNTLPRFYSVVSKSFGISIGLFCFITAIGFLTFGSNSSGLILNNYAGKDVWMSLSRVGVAVSLVFTYPLVFTGCRDGIIDLLGVPAEKKTENGLLNTTTIIMLSIITLLAASLKDVSFVLAIAGGILRLYFSCC